MEERRKNIRRPVNLEIIIRDLNTDQDLGRLENVSEEGAMLMCHRPPGPGAFFHCRVEWPEVTGRTDEMTFHAQSMWCRPKSGTDIWEVGLHVPDFTPDQFAALRAITRKPEVAS
jgi:hypothetical protein